MMMSNSDKMNDDIIPKEVGIDMDVAIEWLHDCAQYFNKKATEAKEDIEYWSSISNANVAIRIADYFDSAQHTNKIIKDNSPDTKFVEELRTGADSYRRLNAEHAARMLDDAASRIENLEQIISAQNEADELYRLANFLDLSEPNDKAKVFFDSFVDGTILGQGNRNILIHSLANQFKDYEKQIKDVERKNEILHNKFNLNKG